SRRQVRILCDSSYRRHTGGRSFRRSSGDGGTRGAENSKREPALVRRRRDRGLQDCPNESERILAQVSRHCKGSHTESICFRQEFGLTNLVIENSSAQSKDTSVDTEDCPVALHPPSF